MTISKDQAVDAMKCVLDATFPDPRFPCSKELAAVALSVLPEELQTSVVGEVLAPLAGQPAHRRDRQVIGYYEARARHTRRGVSQFVGRLPMAWINLPPGVEDIETELGICFAGDRKFPSLKELKAHYENPGLVDYAIAHATLLTPPRYYGARFGAIATYMLYDAHNALRGYVLEAGMATGEAVVTYYGGAPGEEITRQSWYQPTPFSNDKNYYRGRATFDKEGKPSGLHVEVCTAPRADAHVHVTVGYIEASNPDPVWPAKLTAEAAGRVAAIGEKLGKPVGSGLANLLAPALAEWARNTLEWETKP